MTEVVGLRCRKFKNTFGIGELYEGCERITIIRLFLESELNPVALGDWLSDFR